MADFGGFEVTTPEEVLAQMAAQQHQINQLPTAQRRAANAQFQMANMFGNPALDKARRLDKSMTAAQSAFESTTESDPGSLKYEAERLSAMYEATKGLDPLAASQIAAQMTVIDEARFERSRLEAQEERAQEEHDIEQEKLSRLNLQDNTTYIETLDPATGEYTYEAFNVNDPKSRVAFEKARLKDNTAVLTRAEMAERGADDGDADFMLYNRSSFDTKKETLEAAEHALRMGGRILNILTANPDANTSFTVMAGRINSAVQEVKAGLSKAQEVDGHAQIDERGNLSLVRSKLEGVEWFTSLDAKDRAAIEGLTLNMAYVLARSLDPSGRLSDADVDYASRMIAATNNDPRIMARVMTEQLVANADKWRRAERRSIEVLTPRQRKSYQARTLSAVVDGIDDNIASYRHLLVDEAGVMTGGEFDRILTPFSLEPARPGQKAIRRDQGDGDDSDSDLVDGEEALKKKGITVL